MAACNNRAHSRGRVAFSWENKPGVCKSAHRRPDDDANPMQKQLRPPPCTPARKGNGPPKALQKDESIEDPFLAAFRECTSGVDESKNKPAVGLGGGWRNLLGNLSCKHLTAVRDDSLITSPVSKPTIVQKRKKVKNYV